MPGEASSMNPRRPPHITVNSGSGGDLRYTNDVPQTPETPAPGDHSRRLLPSPATAAVASSSRSVYASGHPPESSEMLLPPSRIRGPRPYSDASRADSPGHSAMSSRRTSYSSEGSRSRDSRYGPFASPFDDSRAPSRAGSSGDEDINTQTVAEKYNIMPSAGLLLYPEDVEKDDWLHNPDPSDRDREKFNPFNKRGIMNIGGLACIVIGILLLFIGYPILTFVRNTYGIGLPNACASTPNCLTDQYPLLKNQRVGLIDPATPESAKTKTAKDGTKMKLVFSDEFNTPGRTFYDGDDPYFQAVDIWYGATQDLEWYDPDAVSTENGTLNLKFDAFQSHLLNYRSGMVQSWNKLCFKGGRIEASISLPGKGDVEGFWPGFWTMGNLGRPGYLATTEGMWPYSYWDKCDLGITKNQSAPDGLNWLPGMKLPACTCSSQEHPSPGNSRSSPEIDAIEGSVGYLGPAPWNNGVGSASQSFQVAPFDIFYQPDYNFVEVYDNGVTSMNGYRGGSYQQAFSGVTWLNTKWYDGNAYQTYGFEYKPGGSDKSHVTWFVGDDYTWKADARSLRPNGNIGQRVIPEEPLSVIMNFGMGFSFAQVFLPNLAALMPATMRIDYLRIYQDPNEESVTCDPPGYPTTEYIKAHPKAYLNPNNTRWDSIYKWPKNTFVDGCSA